MAFFDKLKGAADKAKEVAVKAAAVAKEKIEQQQQAAQQAEADRKAAEAEAAQKAEEEKAKEKAEMRKRILNGDPNEEYLNYCYDLATAEEREELNAQMRKKYMEKVSESTNCDQGEGDCCWQNEKFFCTCAHEVDCPKKKYVKKNQLGTLHTPEHFLYIKFLSQFEKCYNILDKSRYSYIHKGCGYLDYAESLRDFFRVFLPEHVGNVYTSREFDFFFDHGLGDDNPVARILYAIHEQADGKTVPHLPTLIEQHNDGVDLTQPFFDNVSLYDRCIRDFVYTVQILDAAGDPFKAVEAFVHPEKVNVEALFNDDGTIKATGFGGPKAGFYGDEIYNIVSTWNEEE